MNTNSIYAALDLHSGHSVLGSMNHDGQWFGWSRFRTEPEQLQRAVRALGGPDVRLTSLREEGQPDSHGDAVAPALGSPEPHFGN